MNKQRWNTVGFIAICFGIISAIGGALASLSTSTIIGIAITFIGIYIVEKTEEPKHDDINHTPGPRFY